MDADIPKNMIYCGHFSVPADTQIDQAMDTAKNDVFGSSATMESLKSFLACGSKPVYMGWGSMTAKSPEYMVDLAAKAVKHSGSRAIVYKGWAGLGMEIL